MSTEVREQLQAALGSAYALERELSAGMARVFVARDVALDRAVVVKVLPEEMSGIVGVERFRREIALAARLQHPHIVPLLSAGAADELLYYTMPFVEGESLRERLVRDGELPVAAALPLLRGLASALSYAHRHGIVHRDVKPENILLSDGFAVVADFGVAKAIQRAAGEDDSPGGHRRTREALTTLGIALGTPAYMAPEQAAADPQTDHRADLYAFGCVAYEMLTGRPPFDGRPTQALLAAHAVEMPEPVARRRPSVPPALAELVMQCLAKRPADRPQSADDIVRALDAMTATVTTPNGTVASAPVASTGSASVFDASAPSAADAFPAGGRGLARHARSLLVFGALVAILVVAGVALLRRRAAGPTLDAGVVAVLPFRVAAAEPSLHYLREGMLDLLVAKLGDRPRALDPRAVLAPWRRAGGGELTDPEPERALALASALGAGLLLEGEVGGTAAHVVLSARLLDVPGGHERARVSVAGAAADLPSLIDSLAARLLIIHAGEGGTSASALAGIPLPALQSYLAGQQAMRVGEYQRAVDAYAHAIELDSTFALAALQLSRSADWSGDPRGEPALSLARRHRDRLGARDQWLLPPADPHQALTSVAEAVSRQEQAVTAVPDVPELWHHLGELYFHDGPLLGSTNGDSRAARALERALALDSTFRPALEHLPLIYRQLGDSLAERRSTLLLGQGARGDFAPLSDFSMATTAAARHDAMEQLLRGPVLIATVGIVGAIEMMDWIPQVDSLHTGVVQRVVTPADQQLLAQGEYFLAMNRGQPRRAARDYTAAIGAKFPATALDAVFWDGDSAAAQPRLDGLARVAAAPRPRTDADRESWTEATFLVAEERLARRDTAPAREAIRRLLALAPIDTSPLSSETPRRYALLLDAQLAAQTGRPDASARLASLDSLMRLGPFGTSLRAVGNLVAARLWEERGDRARAYAAVERTARGPIATQFFSTYLRERAQLAAALGDRNAAIRDYRRYLAARSDAEPSLAAHVAGMRNELARLERGERR